MKNRDYQISTGYKGLIYGSILFFIWILIIIAISAPLYYYINRVVQKMRQENSNIMRFYANIHQSLAQEDDFSQGAKRAFNEIIENRDIPLIFTDKNKIPQDWEGIGIPSNQKTEAAIAEVRQKITTLEISIQPIPITYTDEKSGTQHILGYLYYGDSDLITNLRYLPYFEIGLVTVLILLGLGGSYLFSKSLQKSEQRSIWVGMAKETAHQLGTPLSSLMGWLEIIKSNADERLLKQETLTEMEKDVNRLYKVAARFSQIGSKTELTPQEVKPHLNEVVNYFRRRLPQMKKEVKIVEDYSADIPEIPLNGELFEWVVENLIKNSIDAIKNEKGKIILKLRRYKFGKHLISLDIIDNGIGIQAMNKNIIFKPGFSTKKRGWGLGLNLAKRIIEENHEGKLFIKESRIGEGTTMRILL
ncbi:sensor histidine kinase [candidate division KSB1 bacterium]|nr:sensor histidine kinase [candidate division KSB1 bacterium]